MIRTARGTTRACDGRAWSRRPARGRIPADSPASILDVLGAFPLFAGIEPAELEPLARVSRSRTYALGQQILGEDAGAAGLVLIGHGSARVYRSSAEGDEFLVGELRTGDVFGLSLLFPGAESRSGLIAGEGGSQIISIPEMQFGQWGLAHPRVLLRSLHALGRQYEVLGDRSADLALYPVSKRLARDVLREIEARGSLEIGATHAQLAARIGSKRLEVARSVRELKKHRIVESTRGRRGLRVLDIEELEALAHD